MNPSLAPPAAPPSLVHDVLPYRHLASWLVATAAFVHDGVARREPTLVLAPAASTRRLAAVLGPCLPGVQLLDAEPLAANPGRALAALQRFVDEHGGEPCRAVTELAWADRHPDELEELERHELVLEEGLGGARLWLLCPLPLGDLPEGSVAHLLGLHEGVFDGGRRHPAERSGAPAPTTVLGGALPAPPGDVERHEVAGTHELAALRSFVAAHARRAGLAEQGVEAAVVAVSELLANSLRHGGGAGELLSWHDERGVVHEVHDRGTITDPLAGRLPPRPERFGGRGLWLVHQLCDLVQVRSDADGTTVRIRLHRPPAP